MKKTIHHSEEEYAAAKEYVGEIRGFYSHLSIFIIVNILVWTINLITSRSEIWAIWVTFGWGIGIISHGFSVFAIDGMFGKEWEERKIQEIMNKRNPK